MLLIDQFLGKLEGMSNRPFMKGDRLLTSGMGAIRQAGQLCDKVIFAESTMQMLVEKMAHFEETVQEVQAAVGEVNMAEINERILSFRGAWIEFQKPIENVSAMLCFVPSFYIRTGRDAQHLYLITQKGDVTEVLTSTPGAAWHYLAEIHTCPLCKIERTLCEACKIKLVAWSEIIALSAIIAGQYLAAMRYEEQTFTGTRRIPRKHSNKVRSMPIKHTFKVIDANEIIVKVPVEQREHEKRGSWMDGTEVYEEIRTRPFTRTYRHPRYVHMQGQTTEFPTGIKRLQARKAAGIGKTITKVKASLYEE